MRMAFLGLSITSSWGNGHATTYRSLIRELVARGHEVLFLERDVPWYAENRDMPKPPYGCTELYGSFEDLQARFTGAVREADFVLVGSYVPQGVDVGKWVTSTARGVTAFYDIDTPITMAKLERSDYEYLRPELIPRFDLYLSFTGGPILDHIERHFGAPVARVLYCSVDSTVYHPESYPPKWDLGYLGTYSDDRQPALENVMLDPARRWPEGSFIVAGPLYPEDIDWPSNVERVTHLPPAEHRRFYNSQRLTLNLTRADMRRAGYSPSVRLFEAAACGTPILSDRWRGLESIFEIGSEILVTTSAGDTLACLRDMALDELAAIGRSGMKRVLAEHTAAQRAAQLESYIAEVCGNAPAQTGAAANPRYRL
jgi:spore maturation protein CgeB